MATSSREARDASRRRRRPRPAPTARRSATSTPASWTRTRVEALGVEPHRRRPRGDRRARPTSTELAAAARPAPARGPRRGVVDELRQHRRPPVRPQHRQPRPGRPRPARRVLLPRGRVRRAPRGLRRARRRRCSRLAGWTDDDAGRRRRAGHGARDPAGRRATGTTSAAATSSPPTTSPRSTSCGPRPRRSTGRRGSRRMGGDRRRARRGARPPAQLPRRRSPSALDEVPLDDWKAWLTLPPRAPTPRRTSSAPFVEENFDFYSRTLTGRRGDARPLEARRRPSCNGALGEAVGAEYVARHFPPEAKAQMDELVANLVEAYRVSIGRLDVDERRDPRAGPRQARAVPPQDRLPRRVARLLAPSRSRRDDLLGNVRRASAFETDRQLRQARRARSTATSGS